MSYAVQHTPDLDRVLALPRRDWREGLGGVFGTAEQLIWGLTLRYARPEARERGAGLRACQAVGLAELHDFGGLFAPLQVGAGKTLITLLAPLACRAERPVLLVPARHREKTLRAWDEYARDWVLPGIDVRKVRDGARPGEPALVVESYERVSRDPSLLANLAPDLLLCDEAHCLANPRAAVTKRVRRALEAAAESGARVRFVPLSGTQTKRSVKDYAHLARWALGQLSPLPLSWPALQEWAAYLDEETLDGARPQPGALVRLVPPDRQHEILTDPVTVIRQSFGARCAATPGWVSVSGQGCEASLEVALVRHEIADPALRDAVSRLRAEWVLPDGRPICDALEYASSMREISCGFFYRWVEEPPAEWAAARKAWRQFVGSATEGRGAVKYDTELQVANACARGALDSAGAYEAWRAVRDTFKLVTEPVWVSDEVLRALVDHVQAQKQPAIVWSGHVAVLERLARLVPWPVFGAGGGANLEEHVNKSDQHAVASINACVDGFNLQKRALSVVLGWPPSGKTAEQLVGRTHRDPTEHDTVRAEAFCATIEAAEDLEKAWRAAKYIQDSTRTPQKLVFCDKIGWDPEKNGG